MSAETIWLLGEEGGYHDLACQCERHCRLGFDPRDPNSIARYLQWLHSRVLTAVEPRSACAPATATPRHPCRPAAAHGSQAPGSDRLTDELALGAAAGRAWGAERLEDDLRAETRPGSSAAEAPAPPTRRPTPPAAAAGTFSASTRT